MRTLAGAIALASVAGANADWTATVLRNGNATTFASATAVFGNRQAGTVDGGTSFPKLWQGSAGSESSMVEPSPNSGPAITGMSANHIVGHGRVYTGPNTGYDAAFLWNSDGSQVTVIQAPPGFDEAAFYGISGNQQVGGVFSNRLHPALWHGTAASFVNLLPANFLEGDAVATDGTQQVGTVGNFTQNINQVAVVWQGTAQSAVILHPIGTGWEMSAASGVANGRQVGSVFNWTGSHAAAWSGTAASFVDLHPTNLQVYGRSSISGLSQSVACGDLLRADNLSWQAAVWTSLSPNAVVVLHDFLPPGYDNSRANAVWTDGSTIRVVGSAQRDVTYYEDAILWTYTPNCRADFDRSGAVSVQDLFSFLAAWFANDPRANFNSVDGVSVQDIFDFLAAWFAGC